MNHFKYNFFLKPFFLIWDLTGFILAYFLGWAFQSQEFSIEIITTLLSTNYNNSLIIIYISGLLWVVISFVLDMQHVPHRKSNGEIFKYFYYPQIIFSCAIFLFIIFSNFDSLSRLFVFYYLSIQFFFLLVARVIRIVFVRKIRVRGHNKVKLGIIASVEVVNKINNWLDLKPWSGIQIKKEYYATENKSREQLIRIISDLSVGDYLLLDRNFVSNNSYKESIAMAEDVGVEIFEIIDKINPNISFKNDVTTFGPFFVFKHRLQPLKMAINQINKRIFDFIFSLLFIVTIFWWLYIVISIIIKLTSSGPILYRQKRVGKNGIFFNCIKFRSMRLGSHNINAITQENDPRVYPFGNFLRKSNLDEIPQFINVFLGEMSIVGPRPHMIKEDDMLANELDKYRIRHWVRPGITGFAAVNGFRGGTEDMMLMQKRINYDIKYIESWSLLGDIKICFQTFLAMLRRQNLGH